MAKKEKMTNKDFEKILEDKYNAYFEPDEIKTKIVPLDLVLNGGLETGSLVELSGESQCVDADTEFFTGTGWKRIADYTDGDKILQYNADGTAELIKPLEYHKHPAEYLTLVESKTLNMCVSDEHMIYYLTSKGHLNAKPFKQVLAEYNKNTTGFRGSFINSFSYSSKGIELTDAEIRVMVAAIADGYFRTTSTNHCTMHLKKDRKKQRLIKLLTNANIEYTETINNDYSKFTFYAPRAEKEFTDYWYNCSKEQLEIIVDEIFYWDGSISATGVKSFGTTSLASANFIQFALSALDIKAGLYKCDRRDRIKVTRDKEYQTKSVEYTVLAQKTKYTTMSKGQNSKIQINKYKTIDGYKYCFTTNSGMWVMRRHNKILITGNCGKSTLMLHTAKSLAERGYKTLYIDSEGSVKDDMIRGIGLTPYYATKNNKNNLFTVVRESGYAAVEQLINAALETGEYKLIVIDSWTALANDEYLDITSGRDAVENRVGLDSLLTSRLMKKLNALKTEFNCIFVVINQTRLQMNGYVSSYASTGGQAMKFYPDIRLFMKVKDKLKEKKELIIGEQEIPVGANCTIEARKSRLGIGNIQFPITVYYGKGISNLTAYESLLPTIIVKKKPILEQISSVSYELHLPSGDYKTSKGQNGLHTLVTEHYSEIEEAVDAYLDEYYAKLKAGEDQELEFAETIVEKVAANNVSLDDTVEEVVVLEE